MSFWTDLEAAIKAEEKVLEADIQKILPQIKTVVEADAVTVGKAALAAVIAQAPAVISGSEKLSAATSAVVTSVTASGKSILASTAETAVQTAYNILANK